jgi:hypothetical protein
VRGVGGGEVEGGCSDDVEGGRKEATRSKQSHVSVLL